MVFGVSGSNGARPFCGSKKSKTVAGGHLGMMALSRVTLASAGLSCSKMQAASMLQSPLHANSETADLQPKSITCRFNNLQIHTIRVDAPANRLVFRD